MKLTEAQIQKTCADFLALDGWRPLRTDPTSDKSRGKGFGERGMADHLFIRYGLVKPHPVRGASDSFWGNALSCAHVIWVEFKKIDAKGNPTKPTQKQLDWHRDERAKGALTVIAGIDFPATIEGFQDWYRGSGLAKKATEFDPARPVAARSIP